MRKAIILFLAPLLLFSYAPYSKIKNELRLLSKKAPSTAKVIDIGAGLVVLQIAEKGTLRPQERPAIFVAANINGDYPLATEAAVELAKKLVNEKPSILKDATFYILPVGNPHAYNYLFKTPKREFHKNATRWDDDRDGVIDEDPPEDINGDGYITTMLVKDPEGNYIHDPKDPRIVRKADPLKGEKGEYKLYTEGIDNDNDGEINEDDLGGVNIEKNFPHQWKPHTDDGGLWPASEAYTKAIIDFMFDHENIALVYSFSKFNNLLKLPPQKMGKTVEEMEVKVPKGMAGFLGLDPQKKYTIKQIVEIVKQMGIARGMEITPQMVATFFGLGPAVNINRSDLKFYEKISDEYKKFLKKNGVPTERDVKSPSDGSFEEWVYFQYGVPCFTTDIWSVPKQKKKSSGVLDKLEKMSKEEFLKLPKEEVEKMLKEMGAPSMMTAERVISAVKSGMITPKRMAEMAKKMQKPSAEGREADILAWIDKSLNGKGFIPWKKFNHPTLGEVEIGGFVPYIQTAPPLKLVEKNLKADENFALELAKKLPKLTIRKVKIQKLDKNIYMIKVWVGNEGFLPTSLMHGITNRQVPAVFVEISGGKILYGKKRNRTSKIDGFGTRKFSWVIMGKKGAKITITAFHAKSGKATRTIVLN